jgi:hypothetical protein
VVSSVASSGGWFVSHVDDSSLGICHVTFTASPDSNNGDMPAPLSLGVKFETDATGKTAVVVGTVEGGQAGCCPGQAIRPRHVLVGIGRKVVWGL